jgi:hypothetical protein
MGPRHSATTAGLTATLMFAAVSAEAQGNSCLELEGRLIQVERAGSGQGIAEARQYDASIAQQRNEVDRAMAEARRAGCVGGFLIFQRRAEPKCPQLMATIERMRANLEKLMRARSQTGSDPVSIARARSDILRSLAMNGCGPEYAASGGFLPQPGGLFQSLFGQARFRFPGNDGYFGTQGFDAYRTLCVRTCDGYYFPISFSTLPGKFSADAAMCQQMCPGTEAALYVHRNPGEDASQMVSLDGQPYTALPAAFRYRNEYDKGCTCGAAAVASATTGFTEFSTAATRTGVAAPEAASPAVPMPRLRRGAAGEDPETAANRKGNLDPQATPAAAQEEAVAIGPDGRRIRIVGPADFYAQ